ncbi:hypothetical protein BKA66DRAFT_440055 [Pyrenochaeta sp. MPI-SDFR-AT-0127]|nr:hypothetical protein BKA66DRAFT_440055 [Pyrenochaeta sp. MPI-SDFR-AT-0127]
MQHSNDERFAALYTACNPISCIHDLKCEHRIETAYSTEHCGINCNRPRRGKPFICPDCLVADVRLEMSFEGLDLANDEDDIMMVDDTATSRGTRIQQIAHTELKKLQEQGRRMCKIVPKFSDPTLQFFHQFLLEEGFEGIAEDSHAVLSPSTRYKRPGMAHAMSLTKNIGKPVEVAQQICSQEQSNGTFSLADFMRDWEETERQIKHQEVQSDQGQPTVITTTKNLLEQMGDNRIRSSVEDEATRAVREALAVCQLADRRT